VLVARASETGTVICAAVMKIVLEAAMAPQVTTASYVTKSFMKDSAFHLVHRAFTRFVTQHDRQCFKSASFRYTIATVVVVVVVVVISPPGSAYMGDMCPEEIWNSTRFM